MPASRAARVLSIEAIIAGAACFAIIWIGRPPLSTALAVPFFKDFIIDFGWFFLVFATFIIVGAGNAVNLTDGLDGLAIVPVMIAAASFGMIAYLVGQRRVLRISADQFTCPAPASSRCFAARVLGAGLGFLWFNAPPASIFMGDTGSLALGGMLGTVAVATKHEIVLGSRSAACSCWKRCR